MGSFSKRENKDDRALRALRARMALTYLIFALAFRRSAQYFVIRSDTAFRAAADILRVRRAAFSTLRRAARRL